MGGDHGRVFEAVVPRDVQVANTRDARLSRVVLAAKTTKARHGRRDLRSKVLLDGHGAGITVKLRFLLHPSRRIDPSGWGIPTALAPLVTIMLAKISSPG